MANHVSNYITVIGNEAVIDKFADQVANNTVGREIKGFNSEETYTIQEHVCIDELSFMPKYDEDDSYNWYVDNVGAKWAHIEDGGEDYVNIVSAWSPVSDFCQHLVGYLSQVDPNVILRHQYEDEFRNFVGIQIHWADEGTPDSDYEEIEDAEMGEAMLEMFPDWEEDDFDHWDYHEKYGCVPGEAFDDYVWNWMEEQWEDLYSPFKEVEKEGSFYGYNEKNDNYVHGLDD